jgi:ribosomal protein S11
VTTGNACTVANKSGTITVNPNHVITLSSATATKNQALCINTALTPITYTLAGGATDADVSNLPSGVTASVSGTTLTISGTPTESGTFSYSITTTGNTCTAATESGTITISPTPIGGAVAGNATVCSGTNSTVLTLSGHTGDILKWQSSTDAGFPTPTDIPNTTTTLTAANLTATTYYRAVIQSGACSTPANSVSAVITVNPTSIGGTIAGSATVCSGTNNTVLTLSGHTGNILNWQSSINADFSSPSDITNTAATLTASNLTSTTYYRAVVQSGVCPSINSGSGTITVTPTPTASIATTATTICSGTTTIISFNGTPNAIITYKIDGSADLTATLNSAGVASVTTSALTTTTTLTTTYTLISVSYASSLACTATISGQNVVITTSACSSTLAAKVFIEGAYNTITNLMNDGLRSNNLIPANQPYGTLAFVSPSGGYSGTETVTPSVLAVTGDNAIVDWVLIELRDVNNRSIVVQSRAALLQRDGDIVDMDGVSPVRFNGLVDGDYHVAIRHRLCLTTRTATKITMSARPNGSNTSTVIDFTTNTNALAASQKMLSTGIYGLIIGDIDRNEHINAGDVSEVRLNNPTPFNLFNYLLKGYDMDFNGNIFSSDVAIIRPNNSTDQVNLAQ